MSHSENFLKVIDETPAEVLDAPLDPELVLRVRRKLKMSVDAKKLNNLLHMHSIFRWLDLLNKRTANCLNKRINSKPLNLHPYSVNDSSTLKASADGSIVITLARLTLTILQAQSIRSRPYSVHYSRGISAHYTTAKSADGSIVWAIAEFFVWTKELIANGLDSLNYYRAVSCDYSIA